MRASIKNISERSGVSIATVSRALRDKGEINAETRQHVLRVAEELGYRPNLFAQAIRSRRTHCIGLVQTDSRWGSMLHIEMMDGLVLGLSNAGLQLIVSRVPVSEINDPVAFPALFGQMVADALIFNHNIHVAPELVSFVDSGSIPAVWINFKSQLNAVYPDDVQGGRCMTAHLREMGHRRMLYAHREMDVHKNHYSAGDRLAGYLEGMQGAGCPAQTLLLPQRDNDETLRGITHVLRRDDRPTAVVAGGADVAGWFWRGALELGLKVPQDLSIVIADPLPYSAGLKFTTLDNALKRVGEGAVKMAMERMAEGCPSRPAVAVPYGVWIADSACPPRHGA